VATYALGRIRTSASSDPITFAYTVAGGDHVIVLFIKGDSTNSRTGGAPTLGLYTFTQASTTQKAASLPEVSAELWYLLDPQPGTYTLTIPNTGAIATKHTVAIGRATPGWKIAVPVAGFDAGANGTSVDPAPGNVTVTADMGIAFAMVASGAQTWAPSAQVGTLIANTDDGSHGGGEQYALNPAIGSLNLGWTFGTSDDWGAVAAWFGEVVVNALENYHTPSCASAGVMSVGGIG